MTPHVIWTLKAMASRLGVAEEETVLGYAMRRRDPLRIRVMFGKYWIHTRKLDAWKARQVSGNECPKIGTMPVIAKRFGISVRTARRLARLEWDPLPIEALGTEWPWIYEDAADDWKDAHDRPIQSVLRPTMPENVGK